MRIHIGPYTFVRVRYDADVDALYLSIGDPLSIGVEKCRVIGVQNCRCIGVDKCWWRGRQSLRCGVSSAGCGWPLESSVRMSVRPRRRQDSR